MLALDFRSTALEAITKEHLALIWRKKIVGRHKLCANNEQKNLVKYYKYHVMIDYSAAAMRYFPNLPLCFAEFALHQSDFHRYSKNRGGAETHKTTNTEFGIKLVKSNPADILFDLASFILYDRIV